MLFSCWRVHLGELFLPVSSTCQPCVVTQSKMCSSPMLVLGLTVLMSVCVSIKSVEIVVFVLPSMLSLPAVKFFVVISKEVGFFPFTTLSQRHVVSASLL